MQGTLLDAGSVSASLYTELFRDTNPDAMGSSFSSAALGPSKGEPGWTGFGPGPYTGGYTGQGDRVYWGPYDDSSSSSSSHITHTQPDTGPLSHFGPGGTMQQVVQPEFAGPSEGTISNLGLPSESTSVAASNPMYQSSSEGTLTAVELPGGSIEMQELGSVGSSLNETDISLSGKVSTQPSTVPTSANTSTDIPAFSQTTSVTASNPMIEMQNLGDDYVGVSQASDGTDVYVGEQDVVPGSIEMQEFGNTRSAISEPSFKSSLHQGDTTRGPQPYIDDGTFSESTLPSFIDDLPEISEFNWSDLGDVPEVPEMRQVFAESISDLSNLSLGAEGIGSNMYSSLGFLKNRGVDLITGQMLGPLFSWLDDQTDSPWYSRTIQGTIAMYGLLAGGDPFGVIAAPVVWGIQEYMRQRQRLIDNNDPEAERGRKFGYVREGDKWYPAIQTSKERDEGWIGSNKTQVSFQYGNEIKWKKKKGSTEWIPYFEKGTYRKKNFHVWDSEVDDPENDAGETYQKRADPLRDFYYLSEKETQQYLEGVAGGAAAQQSSPGTEFTKEQQEAIQAAQKAAFESFAPKDDQSWTEWWEQHSPEEAKEYAKRGAYIDQLQDIRKSLEFMQGYRYSNQGSVENEDFGADEFEGSREFRKAVLDEGWLGTPQWAKDKTVANPMGAAVKVGYNYTDFSTRGQGSRFQDSAEMRYLADEFYKQRDILYKTQKAAGTSMGFNKIFGTHVKDYTPEYYGADGTLYKGEPTSYQPFTGDSLKNLADNGWALYQDNTWEFGPLDSADELRDAITKIEASGDPEFMGTEHYRNEDQRSYLAQKAYTRYLFSKINQMNGHDYTFEQGPELPPGTSGTDYMNQDPDRFRGKEHIGYDWALDPMYSAIDDQELPVGSYGVSVAHGSDYVPPETTRYGQDTSAYHNLIRSGVISSGTTRNPDYIAGRFDSVQAYEDQLGFENLRYDEYTQTYVSEGSQTPGTVFNPETNRYEIPPSFKPPGAILPTLPEDEEDIDFHDTWGDTQVDTWGPDGPQITPEMEEQMKADLEEYNALHSDPPPAPPTKPAQDPVTMHHDDQPHWVPEVHERVTYAPDDTAPEHIPSSIARGENIKTV